MRVPAVVPAINGSVIEADTAETAGAAADVTERLAWFYDASWCGKNE